MQRIEKSFISIQKCLIMIFIMILPFSFYACENDGKVMFLIYYKSKSYIEVKKFSVGMVVVEDRKDSSYLIKDDYLDDFHKQLISLKDFVEKSKVKDYRTTKFLFNKEDAHVFCNGDSYFSLGKNSDGYYYIQELIGYVVYTIGTTGNGYQKEFTVPPDLYNVRYSTQNVAEELDIIFGETIPISYDWEYLKNFYSRLGYTQINEEQKRITINCYTVITDSQLKFGSEKIETIDMLFSSENDVNSIKFVV